MSDETKLSISLTIRDTLDYFDEEVVAKNVWPYMTPFLTRRHGINNGRVILQNGAIEIAWEYKDLEEELDS